VRTAVAEPKQIAISGQVEGVNQQTVGWYDANYSMEIHSDYPAFSSHI
jgi:hypothetical protein